MIIVGREFTVRPAGALFRLCQGRPALTISWIETFGRFRRSNGAMTPPCPACDEPMKQYGRAFQCEPCREIIVFFDVSDASPYIEAGRVHGQSASGHKSRETMQHQQRRG
jgi:hypothetical protein